MEKTLVSLQSLGAGGAGNEAAFFLLRNSQLTTCNYARIHTASKQWRAMGKVAYNFSTREYVLTATSLESVRPHAELFRHAFASRNASLHFLFFP